jgi:hypothetical protein
MPDGIIRMALGTQLLIPPMEMEMKCFRDFLVIERFHTDVAYRAGWLLLLGGYIDMIRLAH